MDVLHDKQDFYGPISIKERFNSSAMHDVFTVSFTSECPDVIRVPIAHGEGNYFISDDGLKRLEDNGQILFRYCEPDGAITPSANPNGSVSNIAGIINREGNVLGMMPHPERAVEEIIGSIDGLKIFESARAACTQVAGAGSK